MRITNISITLIILLSINLNTLSQHFVELDTTNTKYKFPKLVYPENPKVEEKVNTSLHINNLLILPGKYKKSPYGVITNKRTVRQTYEFQSWVDLSKHPNILSVKIKGVADGKETFIFYSFFDKRTGDRFIFSDLFTKQGFKNLKKEIDNIEEETRFIIDNDTIYIDQGTRIPKKYHLTEIKPYLNDYGINLLFESENIVRRNSLREKFMEGKGVDYGGKPIVYQIYIPVLDKKGNATIYYWNKKYRVLNFFSDSKIKNGILQADDYYYDTFRNKKTHNMYSLHLEKQSDDTWVGELQLGSPFYKLTFKEY